MIHFKQIDSTNKWAKEQVNELSAGRPLWALTWIVADKQSGGYGRRGNQWLSPTGNLYATVFFCIPMEERDKLSSFAQLLVLCCAQLLDREGVHLQIKWPNDLFFEGKKCGGVLTESVELQDRLGVIIGIGLNVNQSIVADQPSTTLAEIAGRTFDLRELLQKIAEKFELEYTKDLSNLSARIEPRLAFKGERIVARDGSGKKLEGLCEGLTADGKLLIRLKDGQLRAFSCGEIEKIRNYD